jgi:P-type E1-E2 ATPase
VSHDAALMLHVAVPGRDALDLEHLVLDVNGTLTDRGRLLDGVGPRLTALRASLTLHVLSADTYGNAEEIAAVAGATYRRVEHGDEKRAHVDRLGAARTAAIGNGANDAAMLAAAALGIAVIGPEGTGTAALAAADVLAGSIVVALDLLADPTALAATLRP